MSEHNSQEMVQALEQIIDGGTLTIEQVWSSEEAEQEYQLFLSSSVLEGAMEIEPDDEGYTMYEWLEAMVAITENNGYAPSPLCIEHIRSVMDGSYKLTSLFENDDRIEKVSMRLSIDIDEECFSGMNIVLTLHMQRRDYEGVLVGIHLMDIYAYDIPVCA